MEYKETTSKEGDVVYPEVIPNIASSNKKLRTKYVRDRAFIHLFKFNFSLEEIALAMKASMGTIWGLKRKYFGNK